MSNGFYGCWKCLSNKGVTTTYSPFFDPQIPFVLPETIRRAWELFNQNTGADSLRAVEKCKQHPGKMWIIHGKYMLPVMPFADGTTPWHSSQYAALPEDIRSKLPVLKLPGVRITLQQNTIAGDVIIPFICKGLEGFDINEPEDWVLAEHYLAKGEVSLPVISNPIYLIND